MSPEQSLAPLPPVAGWSPAAARARPVLRLQVMPWPSEASAHNVTTADSGSSR